MSGALTGGVGGMSPVILTSVSTVAHSNLSAAKGLRVKMSMSFPFGMASESSATASGLGIMPWSADGSGGGGRAGTHSLVLGFLLVFSSCSGVCIPQDGI